MNRLHDWYADDNSVWGHLCWTKADWTDPFRTEWYGDRLARKIKVLLVTDSNKKMKRYK